MMNKQNAKHLKKSKQSNTYRVGYNYKKKVKNEKKRIEPILTDKNRKR